MPLISRWIFIVLTMLVSTHVRAGDADKIKVAAQLRVDGAYINIPVPGVKTTAAFFTVRNLSDKPATLVSIQTDIANRAEFHSHTNKNGVMQMRHEKQIVIPPKSSLAFTPGSYHVMLFELKRSIQTGEELHLLLELDDGSKLVASAKVKSIFDKPHHH